MQTSAELSITGLSRLPAVISRGQIAISPKPLVWSVQIPTSGSKASKQQSSCKRK